MPGLEGPSTREPASEESLLDIAYSKLDAIDAAHSGRLLWWDPEDKTGRRKVTVGDFVTVLRLREQDAKEAHRLAAEYRDRYTAELDRQEEDRSLQPLLEALWGELAVFDEKGSFRWDTVRRIRDGLRASGLPGTAPKKAAPLTIRERLVEAITENVMTTRSNLRFITDNDIDDLVKIVQELVDADPNG